MRPRGHASPRQFFSNIKTTQMVNRCPLPLSLNYSIFGLLSEPVDPFYCGWGYTATWVQLKTVSQCRLHARSQVIIVEIWDSSLFCFSGFAQLFFNFQVSSLATRFCPFCPSGLFFIHWACSWFLFPAPARQAVMADGFPSCLQSW